MKKLLMVFLAVLLGVNAYAIAPSTPVTVSVITDTSVNLVGRSTNLFQQNVSLLAAAGVVFTNDTADFAPATLTNNSIFTFVTTNFFTNAITPSILISGAITNYVIPGATNDVNGLYQPFDYLDVINGNCVNSNANFIIFGGGPANGANTTNLYELDDLNTLVTFYVCNDPNGANWLPYTNSWGGCIGTLQPTNNITSIVNLTGNASGLSNLTSYIPWSDYNVTEIYKNQTYWGVADCQSVTANSRGMITKGPLGAQGFVEPFWIPTQPGYNYGPAQPELEVRYSPTGAPVWWITCSQFDGNSIWMEPYGWILTSTDLRTWNAFKYDPFNPTNNPAFWNRLTNYYKGYSTNYSTYVYGTPSPAYDRSTGTNWQMFGVCPIQGSSPQDIWAAPFLDANCTVLGTPVALTPSPGNGSYYDPSSFYDFNGILNVAMVSGGAYVVIFTNSLNTMATSNWVTRGGYFNIQITTGTNICWHFERPKIYPVTGPTNYYIMTGNVNGRVGTISGPIATGSFNGISKSYDLITWTIPVTNTVASNIPGQSNPTQTNYANGLKMSLGPDAGPPAQLNSEMATVPVTRWDGMAGIAHIAVLSPFTQATNLNQYATNFPCDWADGTSTVGGVPVTAFSTNVVTSVLMSGLGSVSSTTNSQGIHSTINISVQTNGLATTNFVLSQGYLAGTTATNSFDPTNSANSVLSQLLGSNYVTATVTNGLAPTNSSYAITAASFAGSHSGNGAGLTNLTGYGQSSNALNFLAGTGVTTAPEVRLATSFWNSWNSYGQQWLVEAAAFRPGWNTKTGLTTLRGNKFTWTNPTYSWSADGAAISATSTVTIYLPASITNYIVVESWRTDYKSGWTPAGTLYKLVDTNTGSEALTHANTGTSLPNFAYYEAAATGSTTNYSCTSSISWWPPCGTNCNWWLPTAIASFSTGSGNLLKETPARAPQRKVTAVARTASGYVLTYQDCTWGWFTTNLANFTSGIGAISNQCQSFYQITNTPGLAPQFNKLVIGPDSIYTPLLITNDSTGSMGVGTTNFILESVQVLTFTNQNQIPGLVAQSYHASFYLDIPPTQTEYPMVLSDSRTASGYYNYGVCSNSWFDIWQQRHHRNFNYANYGSASARWQDLGGCWAPWGGWGVITNIPTDMGLAVTVFASFDNGSASLTANIWTNDFYYFTNAVIPIAVAYPNARWTIGDDYGIATNSSAFSVSLATMLQYETNWWNFNQLLMTNLSQYPFVRKWIQYPYISQSTLLAYTWDGAHFGYTTNNATVNNWMADQYETQNPLVYWPPSIPMPPTLFTTNMWSVQSMFQ